MKDLRSPFVEELSFSANLRVGYENTVISGAQDELAVKPSSASNPINRL